MFTATNSQNAVVIGSLEPERTYGVNIVAENQIGPSALMREPKLVVTNPNGLHRYHTPRHCFCCRILVLVYCTLLLFNASFSSPQVIAHTVMEATLTCCLSGSSPLLFLPLELPDFSLLSSLGSGSVPSDMRMECVSLNAFIVPQICSQLVISLLYFIILISVRI